MKNQLLAIALILYSDFGVGAFDILDIKPDVTPEVKIIDIEEPSESIAKKSKEIAALVKDQNDKIQLGIFNNEFANRINRYDLDTQKINDIYSLAGKLFFKDAMVGKYKGLAESIKSLFIEILGEENHKITKEEQEKTKENFHGVAWALLCEE